MKSFVISVKCHIERRKYIVEEFANHYIDFEFFDAVTPNDNLKLLSFYNLNMETELSKLEVSCFLSHYMLWRKVVAEGLPYIAIFEDDIHLGEQSFNYLSKSDWIPKGTHIVKLEKGWQDYVRVGFPSIKIKNRRLYKLRSKHFGTAGYILSHEGAKFLLKKYSGINNLLPVDVLIFGLFLKDPSYKVLQILPALCIQDFLLEGSSEKLISSIEEGRSLYIEGSAKKIKKALYLKLVRELFRPFNQLKSFIFTRKSSFN